MYYFKILCPFCTSFPKKCKHFDISHGKKKKKNILITHCFFFLFFFLFMQPTTKSYSHHPPEIIQPSYKAPDSFILFCKKRTHESKMRGQYITTNELSEEWKLLSNVG